MISKQELLSDLIVAYKDARKRVRKRSYQLDFETNLETNLVDLRDELWERRWKPLPADVFIVFRPVQREVFASQFRDRVVHHLLYNYIVEIFDKLFIRDSYSCRKGKGTSDGIRRLKHHIMSASHGCREQAYILKMDIRGYFMSIDKEALYGILMKNLDRHWERKDDRELIDYLLKTIIFNDVADGCKFRCNRSHWDGLPKSKSLFHTEKGAGLPIGDLTSQLFSNIYLNEFDQYVKRTLKCSHYGRYVDDFYLIDGDKKRLEGWKVEIERFLHDRLGASLNDKKVILQPVSWPILFLGQYIRPWYALPSGRLIHNFKRAAARMNSIACGLMNDIKGNTDMDSLIYAYLDELDMYRTWHTEVNRNRDKLEKMQSVVNSYLGLLKHCDSYRLTYRTCRESPVTHFMWFKEDMSRAGLYDWYKHKYVID